MALATILHSWVLELFRAVYVARFSGAQFPDGTVPGPYGNVWFSVGETLVWLICSVSVQGS